MMKFIFWLLLLFLSHEALSQIDPDLEEAFQIILDQDREKYQYGGISAALIYPDGCIWSGTSGGAREEDTLTTETMFQAGLSTQIFTATLIFMLEEEGKLSVDDAIGFHLPPIPHVDSTITIRQLLNHTSGLDQIFDNMAFDGLLHDSPDRLWTPDTLLSILKPPVMGPGEGFYFTGANYVLLGKLIEQITGNSYDQVLRDRIIDKLGLKNTFLPPYEDVIGELALGKDFSTRLIYDGDLTAVLSSLWAGGAIISTPIDVLQFLKALLDGQVISEASLAMLKDTITIKGLFGEWQGMGLGIGFLKHNDIEFYGQTGFVLHRTRAYYSPEYKVGIATFMTELSRSDGFYLLANTVAESLNACTVTSRIDRSLKSDIKIYPNPSDDVIKLVRSDRTNSNYRIQIYNQMGQLLIDVPDVHGSYNLIKKQMGSGQFFVRIILDDKNHSSWVERISFF